MWTNKVLKIVPLFGLLALGACSGGGEGDDSESPTPVTTTDYTVDFSAAHVINATAAPATVSATASLRSARGDDIIASGTVTVSGTTATAVTINAGYAGENGPVAVSLNDAGGGDWAIPSGTEIDINELRRLESTGYYVQIQSADGDLRGQILPPGWAVGTITLDAASVVPVSTSTGSAKAGFAINPSIGTYYARVTVSGVADVTSAGIRDAIAGGVGDLVAPLEESMTTAGVWGSRDINDVNSNDLLTTTGIQLLGNGELYFSVESTSNPDGALRGQIIDETIHVFDTELTTSEVVTAGAPVVSTAEGRATATWVEALARFGVAVNTDIPDALSVGVYEGVPGENGTLVYVLTQDAVLTGNWQLPPTDLSAAQVTAFENGDFYVSINTATNPGGELRGQLFPDALPTLEFKVAESPAATKIFDENGGILSYLTLDNVQHDLIVPPRAILGQELEIAVSEVVEIVGVPPGGQIVSALDFGPDGTSFILQPTLRVDLSTVALPNTPVFPVLNSADGSRRLLFFDLARDVSGNAIPNVVDVLVPHFSGIVFEEENISCTDYLGNGVSEVCIPNGPSGSGGAGGTVGGDYGNPVANSIKKEIHELLAKLGARQVTGGADKLSEEELRELRDLLREWEESVNIRINVLESGGFSNKELKDLIAGDALELEGTRQLLGLEDGSSGSTTGFEQAATAANGYEDYVIGLCETVGAVETTVLDALKNVELLQMLGQDQGNEILERLGEDGTICPNPNFDGTYTVSARGPIFDCEDSSFNESISIELNGGVADTADSKVKRVFLSGSQGVITGMSVEFQIRLDELGRVVEPVGRGSGKGTFDDGESTGSFSYTGDVTLKNATGSTQRFGFSLVGSGSGGGGGCTGTTAFFEIR